MKTLLAAACLLAALPLSAETIYKYRGKDGKIVYSNHPLPNARLLEWYEIQPTAPAPHRSPSEYDVKGEERVRKSLDALDQAWTEVQESGRALAQAEARLAAGADAEGGESRGIGESGAAADVGGPGPSAPAAVGGPGSPAVGGRMTPGRGRGPSPDYLARVASLESAVKAARTRNEAAWRAYNQLR